MKVCWGWVQQLVELGPRRVELGLCRGMAGSGSGFSLFQPGLCAAQFRLRFLEPGVQATVPQLP